MRVLFFGSLGSFSALHLDTLASTHDVIGVVCGLERRGPRAALARMLRSAGLLTDPCGAVARKHRIPRWFAGRSGERLEALTAELKPDVVCVAGYPWLLPAGVWRRPPFGALNCHASLLPRHRGVLPLFWIYFHDDRHTGVTVHRLNDRPDAGDIVGQEVYPLPRGFPVDELNRMNAERGSRALVGALDLVAGHPACGRRQDEAQVTQAPRIVAGTSMVDWTWDVERVWHFLAGLYPRFIEPLRGDHGGALRYGPVLGYERCAHDRRIGQVQRVDEGWRLHCDGGVVRLASHGLGQ